MSFNTSIPVGRSGSATEAMSRPRRAGVVSRSAPTTPLSGFDRARLRQSPVLSGLPADIFEQLLAECRILVLGRDAPLFEQGEPAEDLQIVLEGRIALIGRTPDRRTCILALIGPAEGMVDPAALIRGPHAIGARTVEASRVACLPAALALQALDSGSAFGRGALGSLAQHWQLFLRRLADQKLRSAPQRLASYLAECAVDSARPGGAPQRESGQPQSVRFVLAEDRRTLASHLGMTPENLSRVIGQLRQHGVELNGRAVTIADLDALRHFGCVATEP